MIFFLSLLMLLSLKALGLEEYLSCAQGSACACPDDSVMVREPVRVRNVPSLAVSTCRPLAQTVATALEAPPAPEVVCEETEPQETLYTRMANSFPRDCGYNLRNFNAQGFRETIRHYLQNSQVLCDPGRHHSMCTSAAFLAFLSELRRLKDLGLITEEKIQELSDLRGVAWRYINDQARPDILLHELGLGSGRTIRKSEFPVEGWPREGDLLQLWREDQSGHSVVFGGYLKNGQGEIQGICYWSSNLSTNGYGRACEPLETMNRMIVARFNQ